MSFGKTFIKQVLLSTKEGNLINNWHSEDPLPANADLMHDLHVKKYGGPLNKVRVRAKDSRYNCHGLAFANRRTGIEEDLEIEKILKDDKYRQISYSELESGDVVLYKTKTNEYHHSAVVVNILRENGIVPTPILISKWGFKGSEWIHSISMHPFMDYEIECWTDRS